MVCREHKTGASGGLYSSKQQKLQEKEILLLQRLLAEGECVNFSRAHWHDPADDGMGFSTHHRMTAVCQLAARLRTVSAIPRKRTLTPRLERRNDFQVRTTLHARSERTRRTRYVLHGNSRLHLLERPQLIEFVLHGNSRLHLLERPQLIEFVLHGNSRLHLLERPQLIEFDNSMHASVLLTNATLDH